MCFLLFISVYFLLSCLLFLAVVHDRLFTRCMLLVFITNFLAFCWRMIVLWLAYLFVWLQASSSCFTSVNRAVFSGVCEYVCCVCPSSHMWLMVNIWWTCWRPEPDEDQYALRMNQEPTPAWLWATVYIGQYSTWRIEWLGVSGAAQTSIRPRWFLSWTMNCYGNLPDSQL